MTINKCEITHLKNQKIISLEQCGALLRYRDLRKVGKTTKIDNIVKSFGPWVTDCVLKLCANNMPYYFRDSLWNFSKNSLLDKRLDEIELELKKDCITDECIKNSFRLASEKTQIMRKKKALSNYIEPDFNISIRGDLKLCLNAIHREFCDMDSKK